MKNRAAAIILVVAGVVICLFGCGKKEAQEMIQQAQVAMQNAREADAPRYAPDEYISAEESMSLAHQQFEEREYKDAKSSAITARDQANLARDRALERRDQMQAEEVKEGEGLAYNVPSLYGEEELAGGEKVEAGEVSEEMIEKAVLNDIHFEFDTHYLTEGARETLAEDARWMKEHPSAKIRIEGHCDERGTEEYNMALGEKRARSAMEYLVQLGIDPGRLSTISYGESLPLDPGHNEDAWSRNRRAHFVIVE